MEFDSESNSSAEAVCLRRNFTSTNAHAIDALREDSIERVPCVIKLLPTPKNQASFHDFEEFERLVDASLGCPVTGRVAQ